MLDEVSEYGTHTQDRIHVASRCFYSRLAVVRRNVIGRLTRILRANPARNVRSHLLLAKEEQSTKLGAEANPLPLCPSSQVPVRKTDDFRDKGSR